MVRIRRSDAVLTRRRWGAPRPLLLLSRLPVAAGNPVGTDSDVLDKETP
jgi:hypothetical protein